MRTIRSLDKFQVLSGSVLKLIAVISMFIDHSCLVFAPEFPFLTTPFLSIMGKKITIYYILRKIGRLAFPIYCFLIGEGFAHTRNQKNYILKLLLFAILSELPFNLMVSGRLFCLTQQNVFFTLFFGALSIYLFESTKGELKKAVLMLAVLTAALLMRIDYGLSGVVLILLIYILKKHRAAQAVAAFPLLSGGLAAFAAFIPINMYNGQRGFIKSSVLKHFFYLFYPLHILVLVLIKQLLNNI